MGHNVSVTWGGAESLTRTVSVVIPTRVRDPAFLRKAIAAVHDDPTVTEVLVVLDGDETVERHSAFLSDLPPKVRACVVPGAGGRPNAARALGAAQAAGDVVLFLDDDVLAGPGLAGGHAARHQEHPGLVVVGWMPVAEHLLRTSAPARVYSRDYERVCRRYEESPDAVLFDLWSGNVSLRRSDCMRVGLFNHVFPYRQHEDRELGFRCRAAGLRGVFDRSLLATHHYVRSADDFLALARQQVRENHALHVLHPDIAGPWRPEKYRAGAPWYQRWIAGRYTMTETERERRATLAALRLAGRAGRALHAQRLEDRSLTLARTVVQHSTVRYLVALDAQRAAATGGDDETDQLATSDAMPATIITKPSAT